MHWSASDLCLYHYNHDMICYDMRVLRQLVTRTAREPARTQTTPSLATSADLTTSPSLAEPTERARVTGDYFRF